MHTMEEKTVFPRGYSSRDEGGLEALLEQSRRRVWGWLAQRVSDPEVVSDLTQEVLIKFWENRGQWNPQYRLGPWLLRIAANHYCDWQRRRPQDLLAQSLPHQEAVFEGNGNSEEQSPAQQVLQEEFLGQVRTAVSDLPSKYAQVLWLYYLEGRKCADIARRLELSVTQVEGRLFRGRAMLKTSLQSYVEA